MPFRDNGMRVKGDLVVYLCARPRAPPSQRAVWGRTHVLAQSAARHETRAMLCSYQQGLILPCAPSAVVNWPELQVQAKSWLRVAMYVGGLYLFLTNSTLCILLFFVYSSLRQRVA
jgi:hypothetical protein